MTLTQIKRQFVAGQVVTVTNHYLTRVDHPCYGTHPRTIKRVTSSHLHFEEFGNVPWPRAAQMQSDAGVVRLFGGGIGQRPDELFLTINTNT